MSAPEALAAAASEDLQADGRETRRERLRDWLHHLEHVLPGQAPIRDFVHHNTLHGYQQLPFPEALHAAAQVTGAHGYLPLDRFRELHRAGRITRADLEAALEEVAAEEAGQRLAIGGVVVGRRQVMLAALTGPIAAIAPAALVWQNEELQALSRLQPWIPAAARERFEHAGGERLAVGELWRVCLGALGIDDAVLHAEERFALGEGGDGVGRTRIAAAADALWQTLAGRVGVQWTMRAVTAALTGEDVLEALRPYLVRQFAAHLDQGLAGWHNPARSRGLYAAWRDSAARDAAWSLAELGEARREIAGLPEDATDCVLGELERIGLAEERWTGYLERLALELSGWAGMFLWRSARPGYAGSREVPVDMMDFLAVRLVMERLACEEALRRHCGAAARLPLLAEHFRRHPAELLVRHACHAEPLPEDLTGFAAHLLDAGQERAAVRDGAAWDWLARRIIAWREAAPGAGHTAARSAWPLFLLAQQLGLVAEDLAALGREGAETLLGWLAALDEERAGFVWLVAYERNYREQIFAALAANHGRWRGHDGLPRAQLVFCMDDREEGMRRHLEEIDGGVETFGAAAHFNVFQYWRGLDDREPTPLCPVVARPSHNVEEQPRADDAALAAHRRRRALRLAWKERLHQGTRRHPLAAAALIAATAPAAALALAGKVLVPARLAELAERLRRAFERSLPTRIEFTALASGPATPEAPRFGFTDSEQADRVSAFLRNIGLTRDFAPLVLIVGHGSNSQNNPHLAAYDCGACSGRHSGPNARLLAAMANRPQVRALVAQRGIAIPEGSWFVGAEHDTCDEVVTCYDLEDVPAALQAPLAALRRTLEQAGRAHAQERCRRLASAPLAIGMQQAWWHVADRRHDFSQARPELGHATNACAFIGRRAMSRGAFFDRRSFLISYDPTQDAEGKVLEGLLLANGPVGAGINLEYYFSTVNNERLGCGTKIVHNVAGLFGVMEGASSDLRTGLPRQMIEIHEAMRLLVIVEHQVEVVGEIYARQPPLQELVGNGWLLLAVKDPDSPRIDFFDPARGFLRWPGAEAPPTVPASRDWFAGKREALPPALLAAPISL